MTHPEDPLTREILGVARRYLSMYADWPLEQAMEVAISECDAWVRVDSGSPSLSSLFATLAEENPSRE